jgi:hypothetical protein
MEIPMKKILFILPALVIFLALANGHSAWADSEPGYYSASDQPDQNLLTPEELDDLLAPIALYPDPLIAQLLPAATFVDQIDEAARYVRQYGRAARIDDQPWDVSVKAVAHYPDVLYMMDQKYDWTVSLGQAFIDQPQDVMDSIQALREDAYEQGNLVSNAQQQITVEPGAIRIDPAAPEYIYVPVYDPQVVYVERGPSYGFITFGAGLAIGAWLSRDLDWRGHRVYYHGWRGGGWVSRSRPHIQDKRGIYINQRAATVTTNHKVLQHDSNRFRQQLHQDVQRRPVVPGRPARPPRSNQPRPGGSGQPPARPEARPPKPDQSRAPGAEQQRAPAAGQQRPPVAGQQRPPVAGQQRPPAAGQQRPPATAQQHPPAAGQQHPPVAAQQPAAAAPAGQQRPPSSTRDVYRGRDVTNAQPASRTGYGGYGSPKEAATYRERGQTSRQSTPAPAAAPRPVAAPAPRAAAPAPPAPRPAAGSQPRVMAPHVPRPVTPAPRPAAGAPGGRPHEQH